MVAAIVFNAEVRVADHVVCEERDDLIELALLVSKLVAKRQATPVDCADAGCKRQNRPPRQMLRADENGGGEEAEPEDRHGRPREVAIVLVGFHCGDDFGRRIVCVLPENSVGKRHETVDE